MKRSGSVVLILGAGFSQPFGLPVMSQFMATARRRYFDRPGMDKFLDDCYRDMLQFHASMQSSLSKFERDWDNIEELYTQADLLRLVDPKKSTKLCSRIAWAIWDVYRRVRAKGDEVDFKDNAPIAEVVKRVQKAGLNPVIITTNYDCTVEACLQRVDMNYSWPGFEVPVEDSIVGAGSGYGAETNHCRIIKLHGSANWFVKHGDRQKTWLATPVKEEADFDLIRQEYIAAELHKHTPGKYNPGIVPPMLGKASLSPRIAEQWKEAIAAVADARKVWIIGYSFPPTDAFMVRLLTEGLRRNEDFDGLRVIDIVPQDEHRIMRLLAVQLRKAKTVYFQAGSHEALKRMRRYEYPYWEIGAGDAQKHR